jgi:hypothetical protein
MVEGESGHGGRCPQLNNVNASYWCPQPSPVADASRSGTDSGGTGEIRSPVTPSVSRLVANTRNPGAAGNRLTTKSAHSLNMCSQLSSKSNN